MNILDLKRSIHPFIGYRMPSESDGGNGSEGTSGATSSATNGTSSGGGFGMFGVGDYSGYTTGSSEDPGPAPAFNSAKDSQEANVSLGFEAVNKALNSAGIPMADREASSAAIALMTTEERQAVAQTISNIASTPPEKRSAAATAGLAVLSKFGILGAAASGLIGWASSPNTPKENVQNLLNGLGGAAPSANNTPRGDYRGGNDPSLTGGGASPDGTPTTPATTANTSASADPATLATSIANQSWNDWQGDKQALSGQVATNAQRGNALYDTATQAANQNMSLVSGMQSDYNTIYRPAGQQYAKYVGMLGSQDYQNQQAGRAMADIQQQSDMQMGSAQRNLMRMGVNPNSGRMASMANQNAIGTASAQAGAASNARRNTLADWSAGLTKMSDMGNSTLNAAKGLDSSAQAWNTLGMNSGSTGFNQMSDLSKLSAANTQTAGQVAGTAAGAIYNQGQLANASAANAANAAYNQGQLANSNAANARANDAANPWATIGGAVLTNAAKSIDWSSLFS